jgi:hypothetical protein
MTNHPASPKIDCCCQGRSSTTSFAQLKWPITVLSAAFFCFPLLSPALFHFLLNFRPDNDPTLPPSSCFNHPPIFFIPPTCSRSSRLSPLSPLFSTHLPPEGNDSKQQRIRHVQREFAGSIGSQETKDFHCL